MGRQLQPFYSRYIWEADYTALNCPVSAFLCRCQRSLPVAKALLASASLGWPAPLWAGQRLRTQQKLRIERFRTQRLRAAASRPTFSTGEMEKYGIKMWSVHELLTLEWNQQVWRSQNSQKQNDLLNMIYNITSKFNLFLSKIVTTIV